MDLDWLEDFLALAAAHSFSRAAQARHITQPAFSRRIQLLEKWVGTPLFHRYPRQVLLTPAGERFQALVEGLPRELRQARAEALEAAGRMAKGLSIAATHALSFTFFPQWARRTIELAQLGTLNLISDNMAACEELMLRGEASFLLCHRHDADVGRLTGKAFRCHRIGEDVLVPLVAPDSSGAPRWRVAKNHDSPVPYLAYGPQSGLGRILAADWERRGLALALDTAMTARLAAALLTLVRDGRGIAWLPLSLAVDSIAQGALVRASEDTAHETPVEIVLYRPAARLSPVAEAFWKAAT